MLKCNSNKPGPLERGRVFEHCQMCGANSLGVALERAFNPSGRVMTLCRDCRQGSAELLHDELIALREAAQLVVDSWESGDLAGAVNNLDGLLPEKVSRG
jgi:hypothetical protein